MSKEISRLRLSVAAGTRPALVVTGMIVGTLLIRILIDGIFDGKWSVDWQLVVFLLLVFGAGWFFLLLTYTYFKLRADAQVETILQGPHEAELKAPMSGFVAMEYYCLILNRTFVVFIAPEGLFGWKVEGAVDTSNPMYFSQYQERLNNPDLMGDPEAARKLASLPGGFFIPRAEIIAVEAVYKQKWGMGPISHSGRIQVRLASGESREFILLGTADPEAVQKAVLHWAIAPPAASLPTS